MAKPPNASEFPINVDLSECVIQDAICMMMCNLTKGELNVLIKISQWYLFSAADMANRMNRDVINLTIQIEYDSTYKQDEWSIQEIKTGKIIWSPGA